MHGLTVGPVLAAPSPAIAAPDLSLFLVQFAVLLATALLLGRLAMRWGMPAVVGELCAGIVLGPSVLGHLWPGGSAWLLRPGTGHINLLDAVGQVGVVLLVGITALEMDFGLLRRRGATVARIGLAGLVLPLGLGVATGFALPASLQAPDVEPFVFASFLGVAMCVTAIPVIAKTLADMKLLHRNIGQLTLAAAVVVDVIGWMLLAVVSAMATTGAWAGAVGFAIASLVAVVVVATVVGRPVVRSVLWVAGRAREHGPLIASTVVVIMLCAAGTHALRLEAVFGAFVAGLLIGSRPGFDLSRLAPLRTVVMTVFAPLFFAIVGLRIDLSALGRPSVALAAAVVLAVAVFGKFAGAMLGALTSRMNAWEALALGGGMNARGVVEVVVATVGLNLGILTTDMFTIIILMAIATSLMAPPVLRFAMRHVEQTAEEELRCSGLDSPEWSDRA